MAICLKLWWNEMKLKIREKSGHTIPLWVPNRLVFWILKRKIPELQIDSHRVLKLLRKYRGMTILEVEEHRGDYVRIKL